MMTIRELATALQSFDQDSLVMVDGFEEGLDSPIVRTTKAILHPKYDGLSFFKNNGIYS